MEGQRERRKRERKRLKLLVNVLLERRHTLVYFPLFSVYRVASFCLHFDFDEALKVERKEKYETTKGKKRGGIGN